ncbi:AAA domain-containing protein [Nocardiopsis alba]|uniref:AAA domain-containing protein n=1 Tax=Nocardiopsis alba TaxID=53437 RepID=UPI0035D7203E
MADPVDHTRIKLVQQKVHEWTQELIDLGNRNKLLNFKPTKSSSLDLGDCEGESLHSLFQGRKVGLRSLFPDEESRQAAIPRARSLRRKARDFREEQGIEVAKIAYGLIITTKKRGHGRSSPLLLRAPLLLRPVVIESKGTAETIFTLQATGDTQVNQVLLYALVHEYGVDLDITGFCAKTERTLDELSSPEEQVTSVFKELSATALRQGVDLGIEPLATIGLFNYEKLPMVQDLQDATALLAENDLIAAMAGDRCAADSIHNSASDHVPVPVDEIDPKNEYIVLDADSSQHHAIDAASARQHTLIEGPPGTGKSQTIANIIAGAVAHGRRVLFVAEKRAAIEAVTNRLAEAGLENLILDMHRIRDKRHVARQLNESMDRASQEQPVETSEIHQTLRNRRSRLIVHSRELHDLRVPWNMSLYQVREALLCIDDSHACGFTFRRQQLMSLNSTAVHQVEDDLQAFIEKDGLRLLRRESPWWQAEINSSDDARYVLDQLDELAGNTLQASGEGMRKLLTGIGLPVPDDLPGWQSSLDLLSGISQSIETFGPAIFSDELDSLCAATASRATRDRYPKRPSWWRRWSMVRRLRAVTGLGRTSDLHTRLVNAKAQHDRWADLGGPQSLPHEFDDFEQVASTYQRLRDQLAAVAMCTKITDLGDRQADHVEKALQELMDDRELVFRLPELNTTRTRLTSLGLKNFLDEVAIRKATPEQARLMFRHTWLRSLDDEMRLNSAVLREFSGVQHTRAAEEFRAADIKHRDTSARRIRRRVADNVRRVCDDRPDQAKLVRGEASKKSRHLRTRKLVEKAPDVMLAAAPCWAMSPLVVSQTLPARELFDLVIFDEASQVLPHDAITSIMRGKQLIVAGDEKQLPPSTWFSRQLSEDSEEEEEETDLGDFESILGTMRTFIPDQNQHRLRWHYRSQDERLIAFSNQEIYANDLVTFPGPVQNSPLLLEVVEGIASPGQDGSSPEEIRRVTELVLEHAEQRPEESLGVITLGDKHRIRVEKAIRDARSNRPDLDGFFTDDTGPTTRFFVKNIETVQGDERDAIILGVGVARKSNGTVSRTGFGPLNREGGPRRLNVAVTRAKRRMTVVSSFPSTALEPSETATGTELLRRYLEMIERDCDPDDVGRLSGFEPNGFEQDIHRRLAEAGVPVHPQWGFSGHRIDLALGHPDEPGRMVLAIEADGDSYHRSPSARDRDRLRQEHLERLGWRFHRVWASAWFADPEGEAGSILRAWNDSLQASDHRGDPAKPVREKSSSRVERNSHSSESRRGPRPPIPSGLRINDYTDHQLIELFLWLLGDLLQIDRRQRITQAMTELGFQRRGTKIVERLESTLRIAQDFMDKKEQQKEEC